MSVSFTARSLSIGFLSTYKQSVPCPCMAKSFDIKLLYKQTKQAVQICFSDCKAVVIWECSGQEVWCWSLENIVLFNTAGFLAHLSQRFTGELIG